MDYQTLLREAADLSSFSWLLNPPVGDTAPQSDTFANVAFNLPTSPGSYTTLIPPRSHDSQSTYEGIFPETNSSANASSGTTLLDHSPQDFDRDHGDNSESSASSLRIGPEVSYPIRIQEGNPASHARLSASVPMRGPYTPEDIPHPGETVLCDDLNFVTLHPDGLGRDHLCRVSFVYWILQRSLGWHGCESCPKARELWLQMIEGNDDVDEIWLWVDGDEEWIRQNRDTSRWHFWPKLEKDDWVAAQSALRRRIERTQLTPCPVPKKTADLTLEDRARIREATPAQRFAALYWLICTSRCKEEVDLQHGLSSRSNFALRDLIHPWFLAFGSLASFPEQPEAWNDFLEKRKAMGCKCLRWISIFEAETRDWARMMKWLRPEWNLDVDIGCLSPYYCNACTCRAAGIYDRLYGNDHSPDIPLLPIQLAFSLVVAHYCLEYMVFDVIPTPFVKTVASKSLSPNAQREADHRFWPLYSPGERDTIYSPWVNAYPQVMRESLVSQSCEVGPYSRLHSLPPVEAESQGEYLDELPVGFADDAPNLITLVGTVIWISACRFLNGAEDLHRAWAEFIEFKDTLPLPELTGTQLELRNHLEMLWLEDRSSCFRCVDYLDEEDEDNQDYFWMSYAAIIIYVKSLNLSPTFEGCPECHAVYLTVVTGSGSGTETSLAQDSNDRQLPDPIAPSTPRDLVSSHFHRRSLSPPQADDTNGPSLPPSLFDVSLPLDDRQFRFNARLRELTIFLPPAVLPERLLTLPASSCLNIVEIGAKDERHTPAQMKQPRNTVNFTEGVIPGRQIPANMTQEGNLVASRLHSSPDRYVITDGPSGVPSSLPFQPSSIRSTVTASVTQKHFGDIPDLTAYLQRLHIDPVAAGGYGIVYKCSLRHANDHSSEVAVKSFRHELAQNNTSVPQQEFSKTLRREIKVWHGLRHSNIVPLLGIAYGFGSAISTVSPWISGGPLHTYLDTRDADLNLFDRFSLLEGVATGLRYLHSFPVVHGDLTSGNVLIDSDGKACLSDFGLSAVLGGLSGGSSFALTTCRPGAIEWAAPELVLTPDIVKPCLASDIFSFGCIMLQILSGQPPWGKMNRNVIIVSLYKGDRAPRPEHRLIRDVDWDFIRRCWSSADVRPSIEDVVDYISSVLASLRKDHGLAAGVLRETYHSQEDIFGSGA
ncbi:hypothetical protein PAXINDRAFT_100814 [Paxillus involutus ATCC 200175]|uniref:Protein kinase domain-containing protein n=1 Tax=Paxillus involutus ATCC 200175 TaxID=664439 RepID=A0A0C9U199_PAXIN|nr:hypothetical protein PAXINDRAFT_100814 [Paxillus involutus ATCC 200175]